MKNMKFKLWDKIEIDWIDSVQSTRGWEYKVDFPWKTHYNAMPQKTIGFFTNQTKDAISVCQAYSLNRDENLIGVFTIPKGCINKIRKLK